MMMTASDHDDHGGDMKTEMIMTVNDHDEIHDDGGDEDDGK